MGNIINKNPSKKELKILKLESYNSIDLGEKLSWRIVDGKARWVITINGKIIEKNPNKERIKSLADKNPGIRSIPSKKRKINDYEFWNNVLKKGDDECWIWIGNKYMTCKYERGLFNGICAPIVSYSLIFGEIPPNKHVLHKCDNGLCVNPNHLYLGDQIDNSRDAKERGRRGGNKIIFDTYQINYIYNLAYKEGLTKSEIAKRLTVEDGTQHYNSKQIDAVFNNRTVAWSMKKI